MRGQPWEKRQEEEEQTKWNLQQLIWQQEDNQWKANKPGNKHKCQQKNMVATKCDYVFST